MGRLAILFVRLYQHRWSRQLADQGYRCRHHPSCSQYAVIAYRKYRFVAATRLIRARIRDCGADTGRPFVDFP
jgi:putative component of membrane protein insertase Oxa1/YidC/SpoIIIJ protein YidD